MSGMEAKRDGAHVCITIEVGSKKARLKVTPEYARAVAAELLAASMSDEERNNRALRETMDRMLKRAPKSGKGSGDLLDFLRGLI